MKLFQLFVLPIAILLASSMFVFCEEEVEAPDPLMVWLSENLNAPELKAAGYPFDSLAEEPGIDEYLERLSKQVLGESVLFPSRVLPTEVVLIKTAQSIIKINQDSNYRNGDKENFLDDWIQRHRKIEEYTFHYYSEKNFFGIAPLAAGLILAGNTGKIKDIVPFLEFSDYHIGRNGRANVPPNKKYRPMHALSFITRDTRFINLPPEKIIQYWPSVNAVISNPETTVPMLKKVLFSSSYHDDIRIHAAAFLLETAPSELDKKVLTILNGDEKKCLFDIVSKGFKYRCWLMTLLDRIQRPEESVIRRAYLNFMKMRR